MPKNHLGEHYVVEVIWVDGIKCRFCMRVIRVREKAAKFNTKNERGIVTTAYECRECVECCRQTTKKEATP